MARKPFLLFASLIGCFGLVTQLYLSQLTAHTNGIPASLAFIRYISYMTIWVNSIATVFFILVLVAHHSKPGTFLLRPVVETGILLYTTTIGVVYHFLLANTWAPEGLQKAVDISLHYVVPALYLIYWITFAVKGGQHYRNAIKWLAFPLVYMTYTIIRGALVHEYPYPFIDVTQLGYGIALRNAGLLLIAYLLCGLLLVFIDTLLRKRNNSS